MWLYLKFSKYYNKTVLTSAYFYLIYSLIKKINIINMFFFLCIIKTSLKVSEAKELVEPVF